MEHYVTAQQTWAAGLVFMRVGALIMLIPGVGETYVPVRIRLSFALALAVCMGPIAAPMLPPLPATLDVIVGYILRELLIGLLIGSLLRLFLFTLATAGEFISLQTTLSFSQTANPTQAQPGTTVATFLTILGLTLVFDTDLHQMFIAAIAHSYTQFPPIKAAPLKDAADLAAMTVGRTFALAAQMAAPILVFSLVFNVATGLVGRVMPQFQVFFVATPLALLLGLSIFALSLGSIGLVWTGAYRSFVHVFVDG